MRLLWGTHEYPGHKSAKFSKTGKSSSVPRNTHPFDSAVVKRTLSSWSMTKAAHKTPARGRFAPALGFATGAPAAMMHPIAGARAGGPVGQIRLSG